MSNLDQQPGGAQQLSDKFLIEYCSEHKDQLGFLTQKTKTLIGKLKTACEGIEANSSRASAFLDADALSDLWPSLLMDAIHILKLHDKREKAWQQGFHNTKNKKKQSEARECNVYGITDLRKYFSNFTRYERVLYGTEGTYRDHIVHVVRTWLIGVYLMIAFQDAPIGKLRFECPVYSDGNEAHVIANARAISDLERWAMWTIVALCHDLGYPLEKTHKINDAIESMLSFFGNIVTSRYNYSFQTQHQSINDLTLRIIASKVVEVTAPKCSDEDSSKDLPESNVERTGGFATVLQTKYHAKFAHSLEEFRHGIISCLVLMKALVYFLETDYDDNPQGHLTLEDARQFYIRREILRAIASHTCTDVYHLQINTLPFLLIICDELQEWGRPTLYDMKSGLAESYRVDVCVKQCNFTNGDFEAVVRYDGTRVSEEFVKEHFQDLHKLMRAALNDENRKIRFSWEVETGETTYQFEYDSKTGAFEELSTWLGGQIWSIY